MKIKFSQSFLKIKKHLEPNPAEVANIAHQPSSGDVFPSLDGIRGLAILSVVIFHTAYFNPNSSIEKFLYSLTSAGWMGVQIFFVLSGFLISYTVFKSASKFDCFSYAARRLGKIAPPFLLAVFLFAWLCYYWKRPSNLAVSIIAYITTAAHFSAGWAPIDRVCWTLFIEMHFYVVFPLVYFGLRRFTRHPEWATFLVFLVVPPLFRIVTYLTEPMEQENWYLHINLFPRALDNFALGICFSVLYLKRISLPSIASHSRIVVPLGAFILVATYSGYAYLQWRYAISGKPSTLIEETFRYLSEIATFLLLFSVFLPSSNCMVRFLSWGPLSFIGIISYEWYLFHQPPVEYLQEFLGKSSGNILIYLAKTLFPFVGTFLASCAIYFFYSAPILAWTKRRLK